MGALPELPQELHVSTATLPELSRELPASTGALRRLPQELHALADPESESESAI